MIKLIMDVKPNHANIRKDFDCPFCGKHDYFWTKVTPERCTGCGRLLPPMHDLLEKPEELYHWHKHGMKSIGITK